MDLRSPLLKQMNDWYVDDEKILDLKGSIETALAMLDKDSSYEDIEHLLIFNQLLGSVIIDSNKALLEKKFEKVKAERGW